MIRNTFKTFSKNSTKGIFSTFNVKMNNKTEYNKIEISNLKNYSSALYLTDLLFFGDFDLLDGKLKNFHIF
jgi:hypothetical protein